MSKPVKDLMTETLRERCAGVHSACVINISKLDAVRTNLMRGALKKQSIRMHIVKNSLARRAFRGGPLEPLAKSLEGPCALVYGDPAITDIAKELARWTKSHKQIELKQGIIEGDPALVSVLELSKMKGRTELLGDIAMLLAAPGRQIAGALCGPAGRIAGCLKAMIDDPDKQAA